MPEFRGDRIKTGDTVTMRKRVGTMPPSKHARSLDLLIADGWEIVHVKPAGWQPCDNTFDCTGTKHFPECPVGARTSDDAGSES